QTDRYKVRAQNLLAQHAHEETPDGPFPHLLDRDDPAYPVILQALVDFAFELGDPTAVDDDMAKAAIRIGRARYERQQNGTPLEYSTGLPTGRDEQGDPRPVVHYIHQPAIVKLRTTVQLRTRMARV